MAEIDNSTVADVPKEVSRCLGLIAADMNAIRGLLDAAADDGSFHHIDHAISVIAARSGALADLATKHMGNIQSVGDFAEWMS
jgi:hypothetical protein